MSPRVRAHEILLVAVVLTVAGAGFSPARSQPALPPLFTAQNAVPSVVFDLPTCIAFLPDGRMLVGEKRGRVWVVANGIRNPVPLWSREAEVATAIDCGLMSIAVDPNFTANRRVYFLYTADPDSNGVDTDPHAFGRLTRYEFIHPDSASLNPASRAILMGVDWPSGPLVTGGSHTIGALRWGSDGSLLVSIGEGALSSQMDEGGNTPGAFGTGKTDPNEDIGAFRAQDLTSLCGKVLRIDPATGLGYPSNPFYLTSDPASPRSRVWAYGLRNPFRMCVRPGTGAASPAAGDPGSLVLGDVGWLTWEEMDISPQGEENFGWPCYEGPYSQPEYINAHPDHHRCTTIGKPINPSLHTPPPVAWHHTDSSLAVPNGSGLSGNCVIPGAFYAGDRYPQIYRGGLFFCDFGSNVVRVATLDASEQITDIGVFGTDFEGPVDFAPHPATGDLHYVSLISGQVRRIRYEGPSGDAPVAGAEALPPIGAAPLSVAFSSAGSFSPLGRPITTFWTFGDGDGTPDPNPVHGYPETGIYDAVLTVTDDLGASGHDTVRVIVTNGAEFPTTSVLDAFARPDGPIGGQWLDVLFGLQIQNEQLTQTNGLATPVWGGGVFGPEQEAYFTLNAISPSLHHTLMLKVQGTHLATGHIQVRYDATGPRISVSTYAPSQGWRTVGMIELYDLEPEDQFGARAYSNGVVEIYQNGLLLDSFSVGDWPFAEMGGRIGFVLQDGSQTLLDDYGGGTAMIGLNLPPTAVIHTPSDSGFYAGGETIWLVGSGSDPEDSAGELLYHWQVDQHHNNHVHPGIFVADGPTASFVTENHDDGTGTHLSVALQVTDTRGASDTSTVNIFPEVDLDPNGLATLPETPGSTGPSEYRFWLHNHGRMPSPISRWVLQMEGFVIAQGDTLVHELDSVLVVRQIEPIAGPGTYALLVTTDALGRVVETDETNNEQTISVTIVQGSGPDVLPPMFYSGPDVQGFGVTASAEWTTNERAHGVVRYGTTTALGDSVVAPNDTTRHTVSLTGLLPDERYYFQVRVADTLGNARTAPIDSFVTQPGPLASDDLAPVAFALSPAYPNPSRGTVRFSADLPRAARVRLAIFDLQGREVWRQPDLDSPAGRATFGWAGITRDGIPAPPGLYLARVELGPRVFHRRLILVR